VAVDANLIIGAVIYVQANAQPTPQIFVLASRWSRMLTHTGSVQRYLLVFGRARSPLIARRDH
jgi:hypothetical protein